MSERTDIAHVDEPGRALAIPSSGSVIQSILAAAKDPEVDADKVKTLHDLAVGMIDRERAAEFNRSKIAAIREMPAIYKRGKSDKHRYAKFEDLHRAAMPVLAKHGLTLDFKVGSDANFITVQPILRHENGWVEEGGVMKGLPDKGPGRSDIQAVGSATSYLKRHSFKAVMNIIEDGEDNDGAGYGFREGEQKTDRQQRLILDAEAQALEGGETYRRWYGNLNAKDKLFLVQTGTHARCGGGAALPPPAGSSPVGRQAEPEPEVEAEEAIVEDIPVDNSEPEIVDPPRQAEDPVADSTADETTPDPKTPEGWTTIFERNCEAATSLDRIDELKAAGANAIRKLSAEHPKLWERVDRAEMDARDRIKAAPAGDDLFGSDGK